MQSRFSSWRIPCQCIQTLPDCSSFQNRYNRQPSSGAKTGIGSVVSCICVGMQPVFCKSEPCKASAFCSVIATRTLGSRCKAFSDWQATCTVLESGGAFFLFFKSRPIAAASKTDTADNHPPVQKPERAALFPVFVWEWYRYSARVNLARLPHSAR